MKASALEFRHRYLLHVAVFCLGFFAPWNLMLHLDPAFPNAHTWGLLSTKIAQAHITDIGTAFDGVLIVAILLAFAGAGLRTWGAAYLGASIVQDGAMHTSGDAAGVLADGPYRHVRNPLYVGTFLHTLAVAILMPATGAIFTVLAIALMQIRLILGEEAFLSAKLGTQYTAYASLVPRLFPSLRPCLPVAGRQPAWPQAFLGELSMWGVAGSFLALGWRYNAALLIQCVIVSFGASLIGRAIIPGRKEKPAAEASM